MSPKPDAGSEADALDAAAADGGAADVGLEVCGWVDRAAAPDDPSGLEREKFVMAVTAAGSAFVAVGAQDHVVNSFDEDILVRVSCDGETWSEADVPAQSGWLREVAFGNDTLVASGDRGDDSSAGMLVLVRRIGEPWQSFTRPTDDAFRDLRFGNRAFLAIDARGLLRSTDGIAWEPIALDEADVSKVRLFFDGERFLTYSPDHLRISTDGRAWQDWPRPRVFESCGAFLSTADAYLGLCGDTYLPKGADVPATHVYAVSWPRASGSGGITVIGQPDLPYTPLALARLGDVLVALSGSRTYATAIPVGSKPWQLPSAPDTWPELYGMGASANKVVAAGYGFATSADGRVWETQRLR